ncbi:MAG: 23S rRNA (guanosine(2251)-2'-O)-methyltransferase RlmB [Gammaproteobacteria bacterium]|nr:23S rRNA (guanosine(2251)-2'-O)-methyltransferase RlmB [Gammaproteobacteria bacterium]
MKVYGIHTVLTLLKAGKPISKLYCDSHRQDQRFSEILEWADSKKIRVELKSRAMLDQLAEGGVHQGVVAELNSQIHYSDAHLEELLSQAPEPSLILVLDEVQDPHNVGACLRSAEVFGVNMVIAPKDRSGGLTPTARKVASGAAELVPFVQVTNLARTLKFLQEEGYFVTGLAGEASLSIYEIKPSSKMVIVVGQEGRGMRRLTREHCDELCRIPMYGHVESLNVSVATGIVLSTVRELLRG